MKTAKRKTVLRTKPSRQVAVASCRHILSAIAFWTTLIFDRGAARRVAQKGWPSEVNFVASDTNEFLAAGSGGSLVESSAALSSFSKTYDFTTSGRWHGSSDQLDAALSDLVPLAALLEADALCDQMGTHLIDPSAKEVVLTIVKTAWARRTLYRGFSIDLQRLSLLSGLTEKTIRMGAIKKKSGSQAIPTYKDGQKTLVHAKDAYQWLERRPDFKLTRIGGNASIALSTPQTALQLGALLESLRSKADLSIGEVTERLGLKGSFAGSYEALESGWWDARMIDVSLFDVAGLSHLASILGVKNELPFVKSIAEFMAPYRLERQILKQFGDSTKVTKL